MKATWPAWRGEAGRAGLRAAPGRGRVAAPDAGVPGRDPAGPGRRRLGGRARFGRRDRRSPAVAGRDRGRSAAASAPVRPRARRRRGQGGADARPDRRRAREPGAPRARVAPVLAPRDARTGAPAERFRPPRGRMPRRRRSQPTALTLYQQPHPPRGRALRGPGTAAAGPVKGPAQNRHRVVTHCHPHRPIPVLACRSKNFGRSPHDREGTGEGRQGPRRRAQQRRSPRSSASSARDRS